MNSCDCLIAIFILYPVDHKGNDEVTNSRLWIWKDIHSTENWRWIIILPERTRVPLWTPDISTRILPPLLYCFSFIWWLLFFLLPVKWQKKVYIYISWSLFAPSQMLCKCHVFTSKILLISLKWDVEWVQGPPTACNLQSIGSIVRFQSVSHAARALLERNKITCTSLCYMAA